MKILHTSDWHLGRSLYGRKRYEEFSQFLAWLEVALEKENIDALLVAGDVFDTGTPGNRAQELYYRFLYRVSFSCCRHVVVIAGNHDSPSFLDAPRELLKVLDVHVVGAITGNPGDEVIVLNDKDNRPEAIVCAVPYLRDKDLRTVEPGETMDDKNAKFVNGLKNHYADVCANALEKQEGFEESWGVTVPIIAMGHLFTVGGKTVEGDGVRELYVGSLVHVEREAFPSCIDYLALGHLHVPQSVGGSEYMRYSGSPIPMGYGEAGRKKNVLIVDFDGKIPAVSALTVPCFQELVRIEGTLDDINREIEALKQTESRAWLEIEYTGRDVAVNLRETMDEALDGSALELLRLKNKRVMDSLMIPAEDNETLDDLDENQVFTRCLNAFDVPEDEREELMASYREIVMALHETDTRAE